MDRNAKIKRVLAAVIITVAALGLVLAVVGIGGSWVVKVRVQDDILQRLDRLETVVNQVDTVVDQIDEVVGRTTDRIRGIETAVIALGGVIEENQIVLNLISNLLGVDLSTRLAGARDAISSVQSTAEAIDGLIDSVDSLPFIDLKERMPRLGIFGEVADGLDELQSEVEATRDEVDQKKSEIVEGGVSVITDRTGRLLDRLNNLQSLIDEINGRIDSLKMRIQDTRSTLPGRLTQITLVFNLILLLIAVAFLSLLLHALALYRQPELGWRELLLREEKPAPTKAKTTRKSTTTRRKTSSSSKTKP